VPDMRMNDGSLVSTGISLDPEIHHPLANIDVALFQYLDLRHVLWIRLDRVLKGLRACAVCPLEDRWNARSLHQDTEQMLVEGVLRPCREYSSFDLLLTSHCIADARIVEKVLRRAQADHIGVYIKASISARGTSV